MRLPSSLPMQLVPQRDAWRPPPPLPHHHRQPTHMHVKHTNMGTALSLRCQTLFRPDTVCPANNAPQSLCGRPSGSAAVCQGKGGRRCPGPQRPTSVACAQTRRKQSVWPSESHVVTAIMSPPLLSLLSQWSQRMKTQMRSRLPPRTPFVCGACWQHLVSLPLVRRELF